ncbi:DinB family protein [Mucilaginibacter hurinus]|nr:DinB family protein [Mucilaginibacter hurinus]
MKLDQSTLLRQLYAEVQNITDSIRQVTAQHSSILNTAPAPDSWSIIQVIKHLNTYNKYYVPVVKLKLQHSTAIAQNPTTFKPGLLGDYFVKMMQPAHNGQVKTRYKAAARHLPVGLENTEKELQAFYDGQQDLLNLLQAAGNHDLNRVTVPTSIATLIRIKTADALRFLVAHQQRHLLQIQRAVTQLAGNNSLVSVAISESKQINFTY